MEKKDRLNHFVYSTNPDYAPEPEETFEEDIPTGKQQLRVYPDKRNRNGKIVTVITGFQGSEEQLEALGKKLKSHCGTGGTVKDGQILIQGQFIEKICRFLEKNGYRFKVSGV